MTPPALLLTIMAHPDDAELWAGGTILRHIHDGGAAVIAVARHDQVRDAEAAAGAHILGADLYMMNNHTPDAIRTALAEIRPDVVITHSADDIHPHHQRCAHSVMEVLPDCVINTGRPSRVYHCDGYNSLDRFGRPLDLPAIVDVSAHWEAKLAALRAHVSQPITNHFEPMAQTQGELHGRRIGAYRAEAFRALPVLGRLPASTSL